MSIARRKGPPKDSNALAARTTALITAPAASGRQSVANISRLLRSRTRPSAPNNVGVIASVTANRAMATACDERAKYATGQMHRKNAANRTHCSRAETAGWPITSKAEYTLLDSPRTRNASASQGKIGLTSPHWGPSTRSTMSLVTSVTPTEVEVQIKADQ